jgi:hypothetical protein
LVFLLVGGIAAVAILAALVEDDSASRASAGATSSTEVSLCNPAQLDLSIRASGFAAHVAALRLSGSEPCDVGTLRITATVVDRNGDRAPTTVAPPRQLTGELHPGEELIATFDYTTRCRQRGPFSATVVAGGEIGTITAAAPVGVRRDPFTKSPCDST